MSLKSIQTKYNIYFKKLAKRKYKVTLTLTPRRKREDIDYIAYTLEGRFWGNKRRGAKSKIKQCRNNL